MVKREVEMKFIVGVIIGILVIIFMVQNTEKVDITFLGWSITMVRAIMILIVFVLGIAAGYVARGFRARKKERKQDLRDQLEEQREEKKEKR
jgi:uncharacterized integral membrane protein